MVSKQLMYYSKYFIFVNKISKVFVLHHKNIVLHIIIELLLIFQLNNNQLLLEIKLLKDNSIYMYVSGGC